MPPPPKITLFYMIQEVYVILYFVISLMHSGYAAADVREMLDINI